MRRILLVLVSGVLAAGLASCSSSHPAVTIGALYPTTGSQGTQGTEELRGVRLAAEWANAHGGVHGRDIRLATGSAERAEAVPSAMAALQRRGAGIIVGTHASPLSAVAADVATQRHLLLWETGAVGLTDGGVTGGANFIRMAPMGGNLGRAAIAFMRDQLAGQLPAHGQLRYGVAHVNDVYGQAVAQGAVEEIRSSGQVLAGVFPYNLAQPDFAALAQQVAAAHVDVLFVSAYLDDAVAFREAIKEAHVPLLASIGTSSSYCHIEFGQKLGADAHGLFASDKPDAANVRLDGLSAEGRRALVFARDTYQRRFGQPMTAPALSGFSNAYALFVHVLPAAASITPTAVAAEAMRTKLPEGSLANGGGMDIAPIGAPDAGNNRAAASVIWEWMPDGNRAVVWPPALAEQPIEYQPLAV